MNLSNRNSTRAPYYETNCDLVLVRLDMMQSRSPSYYDLYLILQKYYKYAFQLESMQNKNLLRQYNIIHPELRDKIGFKVSKRGLEVNFSLSC